MRDFKFKLGDKVYNEFRCEEGSIIAIDTKARNDEQCYVVSGNKYHRDLETFLKYFPELKVLHGTALNTSCDWAYENNLRLIENYEEPIISKFHELREQKREEYEELSDRYNDLKFKKEELERQLKEINKEIKKIGDKKERLEIDFLF